MPTESVIIALGGNLGDRRANLIDAISQLRQQVRVEQVSSVYETEPAYVTDQPRFYNMVLQGRTELPPEELLRFMQAVERRLGRERTIRYGPRPIDLDILVYGDVQLETANLIVPHPRLAERAFVLAPLAEIAPDLIIPGQSEPVAKLLQKLGGHGQGEVVQMMQKLTMQVGRDLKEEESFPQLSLTHVGISGVKRVIHMRNDGRDDLFYAEMDLSIELPPGQKGAHLSRFNDVVEEIVDQISQEAHQTLETLAERIAQEVLRKQQAVRSDVQVRLHFPQDRYTPVSGRLTQEIYTLISIAAATNHRMVRLIGVEAEGTMTNPSAQSMIADRARSRLFEAGFSEQQIEQVLDIVPVATHNQRGRGTLIVGADQPIKAQDLVHIVEGAMSSENYTLLKRPDELFVVAKAHRRPRFIEDAVRDMILGLIEWYPGLPDHTFVQARQLNTETIHNYQVYAERSGTVAELRREINTHSYVTPHLSLESWLQERLNGSN
ncbi:MAG: hypothetical protein Kow0031_34000 [Anaerolineae bacterium]